jgi:glycosyltransferase involved in cell wall biosynthesis
MEVLVVDGLSTDGTRAIVEDLAAHDPRVRLVDNPGGTTPLALNRGLAVARGTVIARVDAHTDLDADYLPRCVAALASHDADAVGGVMITVARSAGVVGRAIVAALSHRFGVGRSAFRTGARAPRWVDTVFNACYRRELFDRVGSFNSHLARGQDMEFHRRVAAAGGRMLLLPDVACRYWARSDLAGFWRHNWQNGVWAVLPFLYSHGAPVRGRHLVPMAFAAVLLLASAMAPFATLGRVVLALLGVTYLLAATVASIDAGRRRRDWAIVSVLPLMFATLHVAYGLGSLWGAVVLGHRWLGGAIRLKATR